MKNVLISLVIFASFQFCFSQQNQDDCNICGKFKLERSDKKDEFLIREGNRQVEIFNNGKSKIVSKVIWINKKEFLLKSRRYVNTPPEWKKYKKSIIKVKILECSENRYVVFASRDGSEGGRFVYTRIE